MPGTGMGQYPANRVDGTQVSSTYEGRHLTFLESEITAPAGLTQKGDPILVGEDIVGVAFNTAVLVTDLIAVDTEGIWNLEVVAEDDQGGMAVAPGDELFINKTTGALSKITNKLTHQRFGYALGTIGQGVTAVIAVKVHWNPDDELEHVGEPGAGPRSIQTIASPRFREYYYEAQGGGYPKGDHLELTISTVRCSSAQALRRVLQWENDDTVGGLIGGYGTVGEFDLIVTVGAGGAGTMNATGVIFLTSHMELTGVNIANFQASWVRIQEYGQLVGDQINNIFEINDTDGDYPYGAGVLQLFAALAGDVGATHRMRFVVNGTPYYFLCRNAVV